MNVMNPLNNLLYFALQDPRISDGQFRLLMHFAFWHMRTKGGDLTGLITDTLDFYSHYFTESDLEQLVECKYLKKVQVNPRLCEYEFCENWMERQYGARQYGDKQYD